MARNGEWHWTHVFPKLQLPEKSPGYPTACGLFSRDCYSIKVRAVTCARCRATRVWKAAYVAYTLRMATIAQVLVLLVGCTGLSHYYRQGRHVHRGCTVDRLNCAPGHVCTPRREDAFLCP